MIKYEIELISPQIDGTEISTTLLANLGQSVDGRLDELLDSFSIDVWNRDREPFSMLDSIRIKSTDKFDNDFFTDFTISDDIPELIGRNPLIYQHNLSLIELTKTLDGYALPGINFVQPLDKAVLRYPTLSSMYDRIIAIYNVETDENFLPTRRFSLDPSVRTVFDTIVPAQVFLKEPTLREALNEIGKQADAIVRLLPGNIITFDFLNMAVLNVNIEDSDVIDYRARQSLEFYGTTIESTAKNVVNDGTANNIPVVFPPSEAWTSIRSSDIIIDENIAAINLPGLPIYQVDKFLVKARSDNVEHDIVQYTAEEKAWGVLPTEGWSTSVVQGENFKQNTLQYTFNGNKVFGFGKEFKTTLTDGNPLFLFDTAVWIEAFKSAGVPIEADLTDYLFKIEYSPIIKDDRFRMEREDIDVINKRYMFKTNQQDTINEFAKFGKNVSGQIQRLGNQSIELSVLVNDLSKIHPINTFVLNYKSIITEREIRFFRYHCLVTYRLDRNFNRIARFVGVDSKRRETDIPVDQDTVFRNIIYEDYCIVNLDGLENNNSHITTLGKQFMLETLIETGVNDIGINNVLMTTDVSGGLIIPIAQKGARSLLKHTFAFDNPVFAANTIVSNLQNGIGQNRDTEKGAKYTKDDGTFDRLSLAYGIIYGSDTNTFAEDDEIGRLYPKINYEQLNFTPLIEVGNIIFDETALQSESKIEGEEFSEFITVTVPTSQNIEQLNFTVNVKQGGIPVTPPVPEEMTLQINIDGEEGIIKRFNITQQVESFVFPINDKVDSEFVYIFGSLNLLLFELELNPISYTETIPDPTDSLQVIKDPSEIIGVEMLTHVLPAESELGEVIVGDAFCEFNNLVGGGLEGVVEVYGTQNRYQKFQKINVKKDVTLGNVGAIDLDIPNNRLTVDVSLIANQSWAIGAVSGELLLAVNPPRTIDNSGISTKVVSFDFQHFRPGVIYNLFEPDIPQIPAAPSNFIAFVQSGTSIRLVWNDNSNNETGFEVWSQEDGESFANQQILAANSTEFTYINLLPDTLYNFRVRSFNDDGNSEYVFTSATTIIDKTLDPSIIIVSTGTTSITYRVRNLDLSEATILSDLGINPPTTNRGIIPSLDSTSDITVTGLDPNTTFTIYAQALGAGKQNSNVVSQVVQTDLGPRTQTPNIESISTTPTSISWRVRNLDASTAEIKSDLGFSTPTTFRGNVSSNGLTSLITVGGLAPDTLFTIAATAEAGGERKSITEFDSATTDPAAPPTAPSNCNLTGIIDGAFIDLTVTWNDNSNNETGFEVELAVDGGSFFQIGTPGANITVFNHRISLLVNYQARVRAVNNDGNSSYATSSLFTP